MSDADVLAAVEALEGWLKGPDALPSPEALGVWNAAFQSAVASAERGPGWAEVVARAHALGAAIEARAAALTALRDQIRTDLGAQQRGDRALKGYGATTG